MRLIGYDMLVMIGKESRVRNLVAASTRTTHDSHSPNQLTINFNYVYFKKEHLYDLVMLLYSESRFFCQNVRCSL